MQGEAHGKMGVGMGDVATPGSTGGAPEQTPSGPGGPTLATPALKWAGRAGPGLPLPFLWIEKGVCEASARGSSGQSGFREPLPGGQTPRPRQGTVGVLACGL